MYVLMELKIRWDSYHNFAEYDGSRWTLALEKVAGKRFSKPLEDLLTNREPLELAQMLLKNPMNEAFELYRS